MANSTNQYGREESFFYVTNVLMYIFTAQDNLVCWDIAVIFRDIVYIAETMAI